MPTRSMRSTGLDTIGGRRPATTGVSAHTIGAALRVALLTLISALIWLATRDVTQLSWIGLLAVASVPALLGPREPVAAPLGRLAEVILVGLGASAVAAAADASGPVSNGVGAAA